MNIIHIKVYILIMLYIIHDYINFIIKILSYNHFLRGSKLSKEKSSFPKDRPRLKPSCKNEKSYLKRA